MEVIDWKFALENCAYDKVVGIKIAKLSGDAGFSTYITSIDPGKCVNAHYHKQGDEHYHIIDGAGEMTITDVFSKATTTLFLGKYHSFVVPSNKSHQLKNCGHAPLILMFSCPESHLSCDRHQLD